MSTEAQVAFYIDFDTIVFSRYDELHGPGAFRNDRAGSQCPSVFVEQRLAETHIDIQAILNYAATSAQSA